MRCIDFIASIIDQCYRITGDEVLLKRTHRFTHLQNFEMLLAIVKRNWQFLQQLATILGPDVQRPTRQTAVFWPCFRINNPILLIVRLCG